MSDQEHVIEVLNEDNRRLFEQNTRLREENEMLHEANRQEQAYIADLREERDTLLAALREIAKPDPGPAVHSGDLESARNLYEWAASLKRVARAAIAEVEEKKP